MDSSELYSELQDYLDKTLGSAPLDEQFWEIGRANLVFELGDKLDNGTVERVNQATERAKKLFADTFQDFEQSIWVLIYDWEPHENYDYSSFLYDQFPKKSIGNFHSRQIMLDNGNEEKVKTRIVIGTLPVKEIRFENILRGIANAEMGFDPSIEQLVHFIDPNQDRFFHMYDDRGCEIWSNDTKKVKELYSKYNDWLVEFHRKEIDEVFE